MISFDSEKCFEDFLFDNKEIIINSFGLCEDSQILRQVDLNPYGICDIISIYVDDISEKIQQVNIDLFELKNTQLKSEHFVQCARYKTFFDNLGHENYHINFNCHLIGMQTFKQSPSDLVYLAQSIDWLSVYETSLHPIDGIEFKFVHGWGVSLSDKGHNTKFNEKLLSVIDSFTEKTNPPKIDQEISE